MVTPEYFRTFGIPILKGRSFTEQDGAGGLPVAIVNETFVKKYLANVDPLTQIVVVQQLRLGTLGPPIEWHIVGVYPDVHNEGVRGEGFPEINVPLWQSPLPLIRITVRTGGDPASMANSIAAAVRSVDSDLPLDQVRTMDQIVDESLAGERFSTVLFASFAGVVVLKEGMLLALVGLSVGLAGTYFVGRVMKTVLYQVSATDPAAIGAVTAVLLLSALLACYIPARRATQVDPMVALREE